jgi:hypothetical protein
MTGIFVLRATFAAPKNKPGREKRQIPPDVY